MSTVINIRTNKATKEQAEIIFKSLGMNMSTAVNMFLEATIRRNGIPFSLELTPNKETIKAFEEGEKMLKEKELPIFDNLDDLWEELET